MAALIQNFVCASPGVLPVAASEIGTVIEREGCAIVRQVVSPDLVSALRDALAAAVEADRLRHGDDYKFFGMVHALMLRGQPFLDLLGQRAVLDIMAAVLGHGCIVHAYNSSSMPPHRTNYSRAVHVDSPRLIPGYVTNVGMTLALDPFTPENGAMQIMPRSFTQRERPSEAEFDREHAVLDLRPGDAIFFNARCWHSGGVNSTDGWRHAATLNVCRAYMRQQFDFPRMLEAAGLRDLPPDVLRFVGGHVRMPATMDEFLAPPEQRPYRPGQE